MTYKETLAKARINGIRPMGLLIAYEVDRNIECSKEITDENFERLCDKVEDIHSFACEHAETLGAFKNVKDICSLINVFVRDDLEELDMISNVSVRRFFEIAMVLSAI